MSGKYIFLDRDGTILKDKTHMHRIEDVEFMPEAIEGLSKLQAIGYQFIIISNQSGVARGFFTRSEAESFHEKVLKKIRDYHVIIKESLFCFHKEEDGCLCRKPNTGLVGKAVKKYGFNLSECFFIGDKDCDIQLGINCKGKTFLIDNGQYQTTVIPDFKVRNLIEVYNIISQRLGW